MASVRVDSKCYGCTKRHTLCWNDCEDYKDYRKRLEEAHKIFGKRLIIQQDNWGKIPPERTRRNKNKEKQ